MIRVVIVAALLFAPAPASAATEDARPWSASVALGNVWLGPEARPTGGLSITASARRVWPLGGWVALTAGASAQAFGFAGGTHWMGFWVSPIVGADAATPLDGLRVGVEVTPAWGRAPVFNNWGLPLRYWGLYPGATLRATYAPGPVGATAYGTVRYVDTLAWTGVGAELGASGTFSW